MKENNITPDTRLMLQTIGYNSDGKDLIDALNYLYKEYKIAITTHAYSDGKFAYIIKIDGWEKEIGARTDTLEAAINCGIRVACWEFIN